MRKSIGMALVLLAGLIGGSSTALAQDAGVRQYSPGTMTDPVDAGDGNGAGEDNSTPELPDGGNADEGGGGSRNPANPGSADRGRVAAEDLDGAGARQPPDPRDARVVARDDRPAALVELHGHERLTVAK